MSAQTFSSSFIFQLTNVSMSGWSMSRMTILAARLVVPPDFVAPAPVSSTLRKDMRPDDVPPPESFSSRARILEKFVPVPEPYLKLRASLFTRSKIHMRSSWTDWMKQAEHWGGAAESVVWRVAP